MPGLSKWKLLSNYYATFSLENINLLSNPSIALTLKIKLLIKKTCKCQIAKIFRGFIPNPIGGLLSRPMRGLPRRTTNPML